MEEFSMVVIIYPLISLLFGILGQILLKKIYIVVGITFLVWLIAAFTIFNESFLIWVLINSILSLVGSGIVYYLKR